MGQSGTCTAFGCEHQVNLHSAHFSVPCNPAETSNTELQVVLQMQHKTPDRGWRHKGSSSWISSWSLLHSTSCRCRMLWIVCCGWTSFVPCCPGTLGHETAAGRTWCVLLILQTTLLDVWDNLVQPSLPWGPGDTLKAVCNADNGILQDMPRHLRETCQMRLLKLFKLSQRMEQYRRAAQSDEREVLNDVQAVFGVFQHLVAQTTGDL